MELYRENKNVFFIPYVWGKRNYGAGIVGSR